MHGFWWYVFHPREAMIRADELAAELLIADSKLDKLGVQYTTLLRHKRALEDETAYLRVKLGYAASRMGNLRKALRSIMEYEQRPTVTRSKRNGAVLCSVKDVRIIGVEAFNALEADDALYEKMANVSGGEK